MTGWNVFELKNMFFTFLYKILFMSFFPVLKLHLIKLSLHAVTVWLAFPNW